MDADRNDETLMLAYGRGDESAFELLYRRHGPGLYRYVLRQCGNAAIAEELFQEVWLKLIKSAPQYRQRARFTTWLYHLAHNGMVDYYRRQGVRAAYNLPQSETRAEAVAPVHEGPQQALQYQRLGKRLLQLIRELPAEQRETFLLRQEAGLSIGQIAAVCDAPAETIKSRWRYAIGRLRKGLEDEK